MQNSRRGETHWQFITWTLHSSGAGVIRVSGRTVRHQLNSSCHPAYRHLVGRICRGSQSQISVV